MGIAGQSSVHILAEWYRPAITDEPLGRSIARIIETAAAVSASGSPVRLRATLAIPDDEIVFAVFDSASEQTVAQVCREAGCPAQRLTAGIDIRFWRRSPKFS
ncbi:hypothetical protein ABW16_11765 [Mycolicibacter heraklionensis]|uniref:Uncharacterized protein n=1 Tax=Mycolicibacter heraklionensis TaxID=512402 RepID=A0A9X7WF79_9MYCO|nr:hypothetical protein [Mycolicibacter heraklionensis]KLO28785.1 hypothetical protein ABW16_11765 [Mycolicibacter heraklionensis]QZA06384.1 hypothetical protein K3U94_15280 [Mycolicibacter heraklionensis]